ncbi:MAG: nitroreductase/quinone reductase family protein [Acidimicrobiales bacterium]
MMPQSDNLNDDTIVARATGACIAGHRYIVRSPVSSRSIVFSVTSKTLTGRFANLLSTKFPWAVQSATHRQIRQFRKSSGKKGALLLGKPCFLLDVVGRKSGESRPVMLMLVRRNDDLVVCGSYAGNPKTPNWYRNLIAADHSIVEVGAERWSVTAQELAEGPERDECWKLLTDAYPDFATYQQLTTRRLPVAILHRTASR